MSPLAAVSLLAGLACAAPEPPVGLDPRLEALGIVHLLGRSRPAGFVAPDSEYARRAREAFARLRRHPAVRLSEALPEEFVYFERSQAVLRRGPLPALAPGLITPYDTARLAGGQEALERWLAALADFAREGEVERFVRESEPLLAPGLGALREAVARGRYMERLESSAGAPFEGEYRISLSPFSRPQEQLNIVSVDADGRNVVHTMFGGDPSAVEGVQAALEDLAETAGHEISHGLLDLPCELSRERIERSRAAHAKLGWDCYGDWLQCVKESVVRAHMLLLLESERGPEALRRWELEEDVSRWPYVKPLLRRLKDYEKERKRWKHLHAYFPRLLEALPEGEAPKPEPVGPGPGWLSEESRPFTTPGQFALALRGLERLLEGAPRDAALLRKRAAFRLLDLNPEGALRDAEAAVAAAPRDPGSRLARALARRALGREAEAEADLLELARLCRGGALPGPPAAACREPAVAAGRFRGSRLPSGPAPRELPPAEDARARRELERGIAAFLAGDPEAEKLFRRAESLAPAEPSAPLSLGVCLEKLGRREEALQAYGRAIERALADPWRHWELAAAAYSSRASALEAAGRAAEARQDLLRARELAPASWPGLAELERRLRGAAAR